MKPAHLKLLPFGADGLGPEAESPNNFEFVTSNLQGTYEFASLLAPVLRGGLLIGLSGPLGAGKTELVRAFVKAIRTAPGDSSPAVDEVVSPSFVLEAIYDTLAADHQLLPAGKRDEQDLPGIISVHHWDLFRLGMQAEIPGEILEYRNSRTALVFIEWPECASGLENLLSLKIMIGFGGLSQEAVLEGKGDDELRSLTLQVYEPELKKAIQSLLSRW